MRLDDFKNEDGLYVDGDGCCYEDAESFVQVGLLGFCGCGEPDKSLAFIRDGLQNIKDASGCSCMKELLDHALTAYKIFGNHSATLFFYYWADREGLTEHGSSIPGWLSPFGEEMLSYLNELDLPETP